MGLGLNPDAARALKDLSNEILYIPVSPTATKPAMPTLSVSTLLRLLNIIGVQVSISEGGAVLLGKMFFTKHG